MRSILRRLHLTIYAYAVKFFRTRAIVKAFESAHAQELTMTPVYGLPMVLARQSQELKAVRAGKLDTAPITDRKSWAMPFLPASVNRLSIPLIKATPYNMRRCSRTPVPRRAMNLIKGAIISQPFDVRPVQGEPPITDDSDQSERIKIAKKVFSHPNNMDSFQTFVEQGLEDMLVFGAFVAELAVTLDPERPLKAWPVNVESIRIFPSFTESTPEMPHYAQMTGLKGERGALLFYEDEILYIKDNPATDNPFGLGKMEVAFQQVIDFLGVQGMAGRSGTDQIHKCFPEWTEVLTRRGWLFWRDVREDDEFATRSTDGQFQWQSALGFVKEWHEGDLIQFRNRNLRITVTPNHRMYGQCFYGKQGDPLGFITAEKLYAAATCKRQGNGKAGGKRVKLRKRRLIDFKVPACSVWKEGKLPSDFAKIGDRTFSWEDWAAFLGIWIAEGSCLGYGQAKPSKGGYRVQIGQSRRANRATYLKIEALLKRMGIDYYAKSDRFVFNDRSIWTYLSTFGGSYTKYVPQCVKDAPASIIKIFVDWAMMGDGSKRGSVYYTASKRLADDMQELFQKIGKSAAVVPYVGRDSEINGQIVHGAGHLIYRVEWKHRRDVRIFPGAGDRGVQRTPERIPYSGLVYCAMVPNGTLYCRENGYAFWSGNTFLWWEAPQNEAHIQVVRRYIQNELEGQAKLSLMTGMKKPETIEVTPVTEADLLLGWQELLIRMIANAFDMSAMALGVEHDINRAVGEVLDDKDFRSAVVPMAKRLQEAFTRKILHGRLGWKDLEFVFLKLDDPDAQTTMDLLARMYSTNSVSSNEIRVKMGFRKAENPLYDCNQFELMLLNAAAAAELQDQAQNRALQRQMSVFGPPGGGGGQEPQGPQEVTEDTEQPQQQAPQQGQQKEKPLGKISGPSVAAPTALSLPKFPVAASRYTAKQLMQMPVNQLTDVYRASGLRATQFLRAVDDSEPGILEQMSDEAKQFFEQLLQQEELKPKPISSKTLNRWKKELAKKVSLQDRRTADMSEWLMKIGRNAGKPGHGRDYPKLTATDKTAGRPGVPPKVTMI